MSYHHGDLRRALIDAALKTIQEQGVAALTVRAVGQQTGVSRTALYRHFADKSALLAAVALEGFQTFRKALEDAVASARARGRDALEEMAVAYVRFAAGNPSHYLVMFGSIEKCADEDIGLREEGERAFHVLVNTIVEEQRAGRLRREPPLGLAQVVWAQVHGIAMLNLEGQLEIEANGLETLTRLACSVLRNGLSGNVIQQSACPTIPSLAVRS